MKIKYVVFWIIVVCFAGIASTYWYMQTKNSKLQSMLTSKNQYNAAPLITVAHPAVKEFTDKVTWIGKVEARDSVLLTAQLNGRITTLLAGDQTMVKKGKPVVRLGGTQIEMQQRKLQSDIESLQSRFDLSSQTVARLRQSLQDQLVTKDQVAEAEAAQIDLQTQLSEAIKSLEALNAQINISAPITGIFTNRHLSLDQDVSPGQVIGSIINPQNLRIVASLSPVADNPLLGKEVRIDINETHTITGKVSSVLPQTSNTGNLQVWIEGEQINRQLKPGQTLSGSLILRSKARALCIPVSAVIYDEQERPNIFLLQGKKYVPKIIRTGVEQDGWVEVISGIDKRQWVVTKGAYELWYRQFSREFKVKD